jgi:hypothetical protein
MHPVSAAICYNGERKKIGNEIFHSLKKYTINPVGHEQIFVGICEYCAEEIFPTNFKF